MTSDDTNATDQLLDDLRARLTRATDTDPLLGTVELTTWELAHLLDQATVIDAQLLAHEFTTGRQSRVIRKRNATITAIEQALTDHPGPLADTITGILHGR